MDVAHRLRRQPLAAPALDADIAPLVVAHVAVALAADEQGRVEHVDVFGLQLLQRDVADVRDDVQQQVVAVRAVRQGAQLRSLCGQPAFDEVVTTDLPHRVGIGHQVGASPSSTLMAPVADRWRLGSRASSRLLAGGQRRKAGAKSYGELE